MHYTTKAYFLVTFFMRISTQPSKGSTERFPLFSLSFFRCLISSEFCKISSISIRFSHFPSSSTSWIVFFFENKSTFSGQWNIYDLSKILLLSSDSYWLLVSKLKLTNFYEWFRNNFCSGSNLNVKLEPW